MTVVETEVCVIGAGPAGATVARRLKELGHTVTILEQSRFPRRRIGESLPPSILPVLEALGLRAAVEHAGFLRPTESIVCWSSDHAMHRSFGAEPGFHVDRGRFDALLLQAAIRSGVQVCQPMHAGRPRRTAQGWLVPASGEDGALTVHARALVDASGRRPRGHTADRHPRGNNAPRTLALWGYWRSVPQRDGGAPSVEAARDVWYWGAPLPDGSFNAAAFVDLHAGAAKRYCEYLAGSALLRHCLDGAPDGGVHACDATPYVDDDPIGADHLRVGEASYAIDPLSSQGVQHALSSALQGSIALHTILAAPADADAAIAFYRARQAAAAATSARTCAQLYAQMDRFADRPFWRGRAADALAATAEAAAGPDSTTAAPGSTDPDVTTPASMAHAITAPDTARAAPTVHPLPADRPLRLASELRVADTPVLLGNLIRRIPALHHPALDRPAAFLGDIALSPLIGQMREGFTAGDLARRWALPLRDSRRVLDWLWHTGLLQER